MIKYTKCQTCYSSLSEEKIKHYCKFCSKKCRIKNEKKIIDSYKPAYTGNVPKASRGAISELLVCADLLKKGFEIFRAVSAHCSCDLIAQKNSKIYRIEVRTGIKNEATKKVYACRNKPGSNFYDVFAIVLKGEIIYEGSEDFS